MNVEVRKADEDELKEFYEMQQTYLDIESSAIFFKNFRAFPDLYLGAFEGQKLVGIAYAGLRNGGIYLRGICVDLGGGYQRLGIGSLLLKAFEKAVACRGQKKLSVGSAPDPNVEKFYMKNGYAPIEIVVKREEREFLRKKVSGYAEGKWLNESLKRELGAGEAIFIFEKAL
jgi:GNAT superfamily N-acetyltransferase